MKEFHDAVKYVLNHGIVKSDRTGVGTKSVFGLMMRFDLIRGFPAITTKKLAWKAVVSELLWFIEGSTNERRLAEILYGDDFHGKKTIWTANADAQGVALGYENNDTVKELGPVYGKQWRNFNGVDQLKEVIHQIKTNPDSRRIIMSAWNPAEINKMALPPCHVMAQFSVTNGELSCMLTQRSADIFLGSPFNIASYALLTEMIAHVCGLNVGSLVYSIGDAHCYLNHIDQANELLSREPLVRPTLWLNPDVKNIEDFTMEDIRLEGYVSHPPIIAPMAV